MKFYSTQKPKKCPACGSEKIAEILYGLPAFSERLQKMLADNEIVLGGCCITGDDPVWRCVDCKADINRLDIDFKDSVN
jgi:hypothetical protein